MKPSLLLVALALSLATRAGAEDVNDRVRVILTDKCLSCHSRDRKKGGLDLTQRAFGLPLELVLWEKVPLVVVKPGLKGGEQGSSARLLFTPIAGDPEVGQAQRELYERQRATQAALLREFGPALEDEEIEPMAELARASLGALGLWWLEHADADRERLVAVLLKMFEGLIDPAADVGAADRVKATKEKER